MIKLKKIVTDLHNDIYENVRETLIKNKADNFLFLFEAYRNNSSNDHQISEHLKLSSNSFYVLKSRLYDRIQNFLSGDIHDNKEEVTRLLHQVPHMCYNASREVATAFLEKLEKDLLYYDMHNELLVVYSALKKIHLYSEKYFHYSQLYNKHLAFSMSLEKSEDILGNFSRMLGEYQFSHSPKSLETLNFLKKGISDHLALNQSHQIELIKNLIELQLDLFCNVKSKEKNTDELLQNIQKTIGSLPDSSPYKAWGPVTDYLSFEYYRRTGHTGHAWKYYEKVNAGTRTIALYSNVCVTSLFFLSKVIFLQAEDKVDLLDYNLKDDVLFDAEDTYTTVVIGIYESMVSYYKGNIKEAASRLNHLLNTNSFKDLFHINIELRLHLVFLYILQKEFDLADNMLKNIQRKIRTEKPEEYANVLDLMKVLAADIKSEPVGLTQKVKDQFTLFMARNIGEKRILPYLEFELKKRYN